MSFFVCAEIHSMPTRIRTFLKDNVHFEYSHMTLLIALSMKKKTKLYSEITRPVSVEIARKSTACRPTCVT